MAEKRYKSFLGKIEKLKDKRRAKTDLEKDAAILGTKSGNSSRKRKESSRKSSPKSVSVSSSCSSSSRRKLHTAKQHDKGSTDNTSDLIKRHHRNRGVNQKNPKEMQITTSSNAIENEGNDDRFTLNDKQKETYIKFINEVCDLGVPGLIKEYMEHIKTYRPSSSQYEAFKKNFRRNRYRDVKCLDRTRVILKQEQDYIHANYVTSKYLLNQFICTQAPLKSTAKDFWTMVLQENVRYIVMLCNMVEHGRKKCHSYYPSEAGENMEFGEIIISNLNVDSHDPATITSLLQINKGNSSLLILHILWSKWPDRGVPQNELAPFEILKLVRQSRKRPTVVHCSAGVGRTGTIVAIEMGLEQLLNCVPLKMVQLCKELRDMRAFSIQTDLQYVYVVKCLLAYAWCCGIFLSTPTLIRKSDIFDQEYKELIDEENGKPAQGSPSGLAIDAIAESPKHHNNADVEDPHCNDSD